MSQLKGIGPDSLCFFLRTTPPLSAAGIEEMFATQPGTDQIVISFQADPQALLAKEIALDLMDLPEVKVYSSGNDSVLAKQYGGQTPNTVVLIERLADATTGAGLTAAHPHTYLRSHAT